MKIFEIADGDQEIGTLLFYRKSGTFIIELRDYLDEWTAPLLFSGFVKRNIFTIPRDYSLMWVRERIIPSGRQNLSSILSNHRMKEYDEMKFLELSEGRCSQDSLSVQKGTVLPEYVRKRMEKNLTDLFVSDPSSLICFFENDTAKRIDLHRLGYIYGVDKVLKNRQLLDSCIVGAGGYYATFNDSIDIPSADLYREGVSLPVQRADFITFLRKNVLDTSQSCQVLECSRQNLSYMVQHDQITPVRKDVMGSLFLKGDVLKHKW